MGGGIFVVGAVHPDIDGFVEVGEVKIFQMDVTAVDTDPDTAESRHRMGLVKSGKVNGKPFFCLIVKKSPGIFTGDIFAEDPLQFNT